MFHRADNNMEEKNAELVDSIRLALNSIPTNRHVDHTNRWKLVRGLTNKAPHYLHDKIIDVIAEFRARNSDSSMNFREAVEDVKKHYQSTNGANFDGMSAAEVIISHGGTITGVAAFAALCSGKRVAQRRRTDRQMIEDARDAIFDTCDRVCEFMNGKNPGDSFNRWTKLRLHLERHDDVKFHQYTEKKQIAPVGSMGVDDDNSLVVPMYEPQFNDFAGWQTISPKGEKKFMYGQPTIGLYYRIGEVIGADVVIVCEGAATGETLHAETGLPVAASLSLHNMLKVAIAMLDCELKPQATRVILAGDTGHDDLLLKWARILNKYYGAGRVSWCAPSMEGAARVRLRKRTTLISMIHQRRPFPKSWKQSANWRHPWSLRKSGSQH